MCSSSLFFFSVPLIFTLFGGRLHFAFLTAAIKFSCFSSNETGPRCFLFLTLVCSFSLFHVNVDI